VRGDMWAGVDAPRGRGKRGGVAHTPNTAPTARWTGSALRHADVSPKRQHFPAAYYYY